MVEVLRGLGCRVLWCDPRFPDSSPLDQLLSECDAITLHCALNSSTRLLFDEARIAQMRKGSLLVNTARGPLVEVAAARAAVSSGHLSGLGLDVFPEEPCSLLPYLSPRIIVTPHAAGWFPELGTACANGVATAVRALIAEEEIPFRILGAE
jgi:phosphoglycerate dehydrogenase-like enzyme